MKILIHLLPGIGNALMFTPTLRLIRKKFPNAEITCLVMYKTCEDLLKDNPNIDKLILYEFQKKGHFRSLFFVIKLRNENFDISIMPYPANNYYYTIVNFLCGGKLRITHKYPIKKFSSLSFLYSKKIPINENIHEIDENFNLVRLIGIESDSNNKKLDLLLDEMSLKSAKDFFIKNNINDKILVIGIHPGSSVQAGMINKRWDKDNFVKVADILYEKLKCNVLIFGGSDEHDLKQYIYDKMNHKPIIVNSKGILETAALISRCNVFLCNDTGLMHIAAALDVPTVVIEGPVDPNKTLPLGDKHKAIFLPLLCRPCYKVGDKLHCRFGHYNCLKYIDIDKVVNTVIKSV